MAIKGIDEVKSITEVIEMLFLALLDCRRLLSAFAVKQVVPFTIGYILLVCVVQGLKAG